MPEEAAKAAVVTSAEEVVDKVSTLCRFSSCPHPVSLKLTLVEQKKVTRPPTQGYSFQNPGKRRRRKVFRGRGTGCWIFKKYVRKRFFVVKIFGFQDFVHAFVFLLADTCLKYWCPFPWLQYLVAPFSCVVIFFLLKRLSWQLLW